MHYKFLSEENKLGICYDLWGGEVWISWSSFI